MRIRGIGKWLSPMIACRGARSANTLHPQRRAYLQQINRLQQTEELPNGWYPNVQELAGRLQNTPLRNGRPATTTDATAVKKRYPDNAYPPCLTIDSSQGQESFMVVMDTGFQHRDRMGKLRALRTYSDTQLISNGQASWMTQVAATCR